MPGRSIEICHVDDIPSGGSRGFSVDGSAGAVALFIVRSGDELNAYLNSCPHTGGPLDWVPDQFLNLEGDLIQCATHDALFRITDGMCVQGPCAGQALTAVPVSVTAGKVVVNL